MINFAFSKSLDDFDVDFLLVVILITFYLGLTSSVYVASHIDIWLHLFTDIEPYPEPFVRLRKLMSQWHLHIYIYIYIYSIYSIFVYHLYIPLCASFVLKIRNTGEKSDWLKSKKKKKGLVDAWLRSKMQSWFPGKQCGSSQFFLKFTHLQRISVLN